MVTDDYDYEEAEFIREQAEVDRLNYKEAKAYIKSLGKESLLKEIRETDTYEGAFWHDGFGQDNPVFKILSDDFTSDREILIAILDTRFGWQNYAYASEALRSEKYILLNLSTNNLYVG